MQRWQRHLAGGESIDGDFDPVAGLLDTGGLVVADEAAKGYYLWKSFDFPTDTLLPGMKIVDDFDSGLKTKLTSWRNSDAPWQGDFVMRIENKGWLGEIVIFRGETKWFRTGKWNGLHFNDIPRFPSAGSDPELDFKQQRLISLSWPYSSIITRTTLHVSGWIHRCAMNARKDKWNVVDTFPRDQCDACGHCGPNAVCAVESFINDGILFLARRKRRVKGKDEDMDLRTIGMAALVEATNNFSSESMIGSGGFRPVYKIRTKGCF